MAVTEQEPLFTAHARARYAALPKTPELRIGVALVEMSPPMGADIAPEATAQFALGQSFPVQVTAFEGQPHPFVWAGHEIHSRHERIHTPTADLIAVAEDMLGYPRRVCRPLAGQQDWAGEPPAGRYYGFDPGQGGDVCRFGGLNGWMVHFQAPSTGDFELSAAVVRHRQDPTSEDAVQLGTLSVHITLT